MKLSFNKQPVTDNTQLNLFKTDFKRNDLVLWNGIAYDSESNSFIRKLFGVDYCYVAGTGLVHVGKKTIKVYHLSTITGYLVFAPVEATVHGKWSEPLLISLKRLDDIVAKHNYFKLTG